MRVESLERRILVEATSSESLGRSVVFLNEGFVSVKCHVARALVRRSGRYLSPDVVRTYRDVACSSSVYAYDLPLIVVFPAFSCTSTALSLLRSVQRQILSHHLTNVFRVSCFDNLGRFPGSCSCIQEWGAHLAERRWITVMNSLVDPFQGTFWYSRAFLFDP